MSIALSTFPNSFSVLQINTLKSAIRKGKRMFLVLHGIGEFGLEDRVFFSRLDGLDLLESGLVLLPNRSLWSKENEIQVKRSVGRCWHRQLNYLDVLQTIFLCRSLCHGPKRSPH